MSPLLAACLLVSSAAPQSADSAQSQPTLSEWKITGASLFKNGFSVVFREAEVKGVKTLDLPLIPGASIGTLWFTASEGLQVTSLLNTASKVKTKHSIVNLAGLLDLNKGKTLVLERLIPGSEGKIEYLTGKPIVVQGSDMVFEMMPSGLETEASQILVSLSTIHKVSAAKGQTLIFQADSEAETRAFRFTFEKPGTGKVYAMSLESGLSWSPAYSLNLISEKRLALISKATIVNDIGSFEKADLALVTGFPHMPFLGSPDPLVQAAGLEMAMRPMGPGGGGFGGGDARFMNQAMAAPMADQSAGFVMPTGEGTQAEDLFFYRTPQISLSKGDRGYFVLFKNEADYKSVYRADLVEPRSLNQESQRRTEVWHTLEFKNPASQPLTTGPAVTMKDGQIIGQDQLDYTSAGATANLRVNKALDITASQTAEEVTREREAMKNWQGIPTHDLVTVEGKLSVRNLKARDVEMDVKMPGLGEMTADEGVITKVAPAVLQVNPQSLLTWRVTVKPGETKTINYRLKVYVSR
jgi:hypothetical protein